jgi:hypothetical protein
VRFEGNEFFQLVVLLFLVSSPNLATSLLQASDLAQRSHRGATWKTFSCFRSLLFPFAEKVVSREMSSLLTSSSHLAALRAAFSKQAASHGASVLSFHSNQPSSRDWHQLRSGCGESCVFFPVDCSLPSVSADSKIRARNAITGLPLRGLEDRRRDASMSKGLERQLLLDTSAFSTLESAPGGRSEPSATIAPLTNVPGIGNGALEKVNLDIRSLMLRVNLEQLAERPRETAVSLWRFVCHSEFPLPSVDAIVLDLVQAANHPDFALLCNMRRSQLALQVASPLLQKKSSLLCRVLRRSGKDAPEFDAFLRGLKGVYGEVQTIHREPFEVEATLDDAPGSSSSVSESPLRRDRQAAGLPASRLLDCVTLLCKDAGSTARMEWLATGSTKWAGQTKQLVKLTEKKNQVLQQRVSNWGGKDYFGAPAQFGFSFNRAPLMSRVIHTSVQPAKSFVKFRAPTFERGVVKQIDPDETNYFAEFEKEVAGKDQARHKAIVREMNTFAQTRVYDPERGSIEHANSGGVRKLQREHKPRGAPRQGAV